MPTNQLRMVESIANSQTCLEADPLEGLNNKIGALPRRAYGYRNYEHPKEKLLSLHHTQFTLQG